MPLTKTEIEKLIKELSSYNYFFDILQRKKYEDFLPVYKLFVESDN